jgi:phage gp29-like protein
MTTPRPETNREIATTADGIDITRGYTGPLLTPYDSVLRSRGGNDLVIYEQVLSDPEVKATLGQRQLAVTQCEWQVEAAGEKRIDRQAADYLRAQLHGIGWDAVTNKMLFGIAYGYAVAEIIYKPDGARIGLQAIKVRNRRRFRYGKEGDLRLLTMDNMFEGIPAPAPYFWNFCSGADNDDEPYGLGLAHWLYWPVLFKRNGLKFWLIYLEKFGMPTAVGKYDAEASAPEKTKLLQATRAVQVDSGIIMPKDMELDLLEAARSGTADYKALQDQMDATIQKVVLGQTASTQGTAGKLGNDELQAAVRGDIIKADADLVCESFNQGPARWLTEWNFPGAAVPRVYRITEEPEDLGALADRDIKIKSLGYKPKQVYIEQTYGPNYEPAEPAPDPLAPPTAIDGAQFADANHAVLQLLRRHYPAAFATSTPAPDPSVVMTRQLDRQLAAPAGVWVDQVRQLAQQVDSLEELRDRLFDLQPDMTLDDYAAAMADGLVAATLTGRYDVQQSTAEG